MFETVFLTVLLNRTPPTILIRSGFDSMFSGREVPQKTITECRDWTGVDPFNEEQMSDFMNELNYMDCVYYDFGAHEHNIYQ